MDSIGVHPLHIFGGNMKDIKLGSRLKTAADFVRSGKVVADIGTDHAYLIAYLVLNDICPFGYACDININPLNKARSTLQEFNLLEKTKLVLCNGLEGVSKNSVDDIVIAGMGGETIISILDSCEWSCDKEKHFILQPMTKASLLRRYLCENGFEIIEEKAVKDASKIYTVMSVYYTGEKFVPDDVFCEVGKLVFDNNQYANEYIENRAQAALKRAEGISKTDLNAAKEVFELYDNIKRCIKC